MSRVSSDACATHDDPVYSHHWILAVRTKENREQDLPFLSTEFCVLVFLNYTRYGWYEFRKLRARKETVSIVNFSWCDWVWRAIRGNVYNNLSPLSPFIVWQIQCKIVNLGSFLSHNDPRTSHAFENYCFYPVSAHPAVWLESQKVIHKWRIN